MSLPGYICLKCGSALTGYEHLAGDGVVVCGKCGYEYKVIGGCIDLACLDIEEDKEKAFYEDFYSKNRKVDRAAGAGGEQSFKDMWTNRLYPERKAALKRMGDIKGKTILCIGNGKRSKELYFAELGADVVISDLSLASVLFMKKKFEGLSGSARFDVIDAYHLPFADGSVDIIYGWQVTHHLSDMDPFLKEIARKLKKGGMAIFVDNADSPLWHWIKWKILGRFIESIHKKKGVSPRDKFISRRGDYVEADLEKMVLSAGFMEFRAERFNLLFYVFSKGIRDVFGIEEITRRDRFLYYLGYFLIRVDNALGAVSGSLRKNRRNMVWSFVK